MPLSELMERAHQRPGKSRRPVAGFLAGHLGRRVGGGDKVDALPRQSAFGIAHASPSSHGKLSQQAVAEGRWIAFAVVARKGDDAL
jgi:hypothetical protein